MKPGSLGLRITTALVLAPLLAAAIVIGGWLFTTVVVALAAVAAVEFYGLTTSKPFRPRVAPGVGLAMVFPLLFYRAPMSAEWIVVVLVAGVLGIAAAQLLDTGAGETIASVSTTLLGALYTGLLLGHLVLVREISRQIPGAPYRVGAILIAVPLVLTWLNDTIAYFAGRTWGRRRLLEAVSPGKTVEGAAVALIVTIAAGALIGAVLSDWFPPLGWAHGLVIGAVIGVASPCGDLIESSFKRDAGVKDVSQLVPGHGGVLDRFDGLLVSVPAFYYYLIGVVL